MTRRAVLFATLLCLTASQGFAQSSSRPPQSRPADHARPLVAEYRGTLTATAAKPVALKPMQRRTSRIPPRGDTRGALNPQPIPPGKSPR